MRINYRPEIDGLRAIAVFSVILYHANFYFFGKNIFTGGFLGVDIFFVISGYLITSIILKEVFITKTFSFQYFYERRIRRIFPVLFFIIFICSIVTYFLFLDENFIDFLKSGISSIFFFSNFYFHYSGNFYGNENSLIKPLTHTWSLSIEEQFYIFFPITLLIIFKFFRKHIFLILFLFFLISLSLAQYSSKTHQSFNFYLLPTRVFELISGSLLAYFKLKKNIVGVRSGNLLKFLSNFNEIIPIIGLALIFCSFIFFNNNQSSYPSILTLVPIAGTSIIILFSKNNLIKRILSCKILTFFGLISYSLYLWHYLIFAFLRYASLFDGSIKIKILSILLCIILSIFSYLIIEKPCRNEKIISFKILIVWLSLSVIILLSFSFYYIKNERPKNIFHKNITEQQNYKDDIKYNRNGDLGNVIIIGDSHAKSLAYYLNEDLKNIGYNLYFSESIFFIQDLELINQEIKNKSSKPILVISHRWIDKINTFNSLKNVNNNLQEIIITSINNLLKNSQAIIIVYPVVEHNFNPQQVIQSRYYFHKVFGKNNFQLPILSTNYIDYKKKSENVFNILNNIKADNLHRVYPHEHFCDTEIKNKCIANDKSILFYYDDNHLSRHGSKYVIKDIINLIKTSK
jgi:peptidoglycan/LPS O-acetylase OafA/YrhL